MRFVDSRRRLIRTIPIAIVTAALLLPAAYNGFPLVFPDTSTYFRVAFGHAWTLDRSGFYGLALKPASLIDPDLGLWVALAIQCTVVAAILTSITYRLVRGSKSPVLICVAICLLTTLPWHAAQLMPDAFTGVLILLAWLLASSDANERGVPLTWLGATALILTHYTHLVIFPAVVIAVLIVRAIFGNALSPIKRNALALILCFSTVVAAQVSANGIMFNRWTVAPMGSYFLFARLHQDGLVADWMNRHCGNDASPELCALRNRLPHDSQMLLWGGAASPLDARINRQTGAPSSWVWIDRMAKANRGSIQEEPVRFALNSLTAGARQFMHFHALDDECPSECQFRGLTKSMPVLGAKISNSRQVQNKLAKRLVRSITDIAAYAALLSMAPVLAVAIRKRDEEIVSLLAAILTGLCINAFLTGALSDVHDRYQSRVVWLASVAILIPLVRWFQFGRAGSATADPQARLAVGAELREKIASLTRHKTAAKSTAAMPSIQ
jgi:hypothetical protein